MMRTIWFIRCILAVLAWCGSVHASSPVPTYSNVKYDVHERTVLDFWQAEGEGPRPLLVYIHGGGWMKGDKRAMRSPQTYLEKGISVASINYRLAPEHPLPAPVHDAARAVQFLRSKAQEWNIDKEKVMLSGGSAGGCSSLWIACHDDLADPDSPDPVARESTRVRGAAVLSAQTSIDPRVIEPWIGPKVFFPMIYKAVGEDSLEAMQANYEQHEAMFQEFSPINHVSADDPPLFLEYPGKEEFMQVPATSFNYGIHHGLFGLKLKEKSSAVGHNKVNLRIKDHDESKTYANVDEFIIKTLLDGPVPAGEARPPSTVLPVPSTLKKFMPGLYEEKLREAKEGPVDLVMIGDSITHAWSRHTELLGQLDFLNLGFPGDRTQNVLWRLQHGAVDGLSPKLVTLLIGTNHMHPAKKGYTPDTPADIYTGIQAVVDELRTRLPSTRILVFSVLPRRPGEANDRVNALNEMLPRIADKKQVFHVSMNQAFLGEDGNYQPSLYNQDGLHLNASGYQAWAHALAPLLEKEGL